MDELSSAIIEEAVNGIISPIIRSIDTLLSWNPQLLSQSNPFEGGVAHIVAASLQTKGIIDQAAILGELGTLNEIAGFFYLVAVALAIGSVAVFGNYRQGMYLLVGPLLYTFMVTTTVNSDGVKARLGDYEVPNSIGRQTSFLKHIKAIDNPGGAEISLFYAAFDGIATEVLHTVIEILLNTANIDHLKLVGREKALSFAITSTTGEYGDVARLISRHVSECNESIRDYARGGSGIFNSTIQPTRDRGDAAADVARAKDKAEKKTIILAVDDYGIKSLLKAYNVLPGIDPDKDIVTTSCTDMWGWIGDILKQIADKQLEIRTVKGSRENIEEGDSQIPEDVRAWLAGGGSSNASVVLAAILYRNAIEQSAIGRLEKHIYHNSPFNNKEYRTVVDNAPTAEAKGGFLALRMFAGTVPYIQGMLLYLLTIAFPFFAVLLVIPGRALGFLAWCSLWVWVKSWDLGFAMVHVVREILWDALKHRSNAHGTVLDWNDPGSIYAFISQNDHFANQNTYFEIISFFTLSVPILTAHFCMGATGMFSMFRNSIDQTAGRFRSFEAGAARRDIATGIDIARQSQLEGVGREAARVVMNGSPKNMTQIGADGKNSGVPLNPYGNQTISGRPIQSDRQSQLFDVGNNMAMVLGAQGPTAAIAWEATRNLVQFSNTDFMNDMQDSYKALQDFEKQSNRGLPADTPALQIAGVSLGKMFEYVESSNGAGRQLRIDTPVPQNILQMPEHREKEHAQRADITWREFIQAELKAASDSGEARSFQATHIARMLPPLDMKVSDTAIQELKPDNPLRLRHENAGGADGQASWKEYLTAVHYEQIERLQERTAFEFRPNASEMQGSSFKFGDQYIHAIAVDKNARIGVVGESNSDFIATPLADAALSFFSKEGKKEAERSGTDNKNTNLGAPGSLGSGGGRGGGDGGDPDGDGPGN